MKKFISAALVAFLFSNTAFAAVGSEILSPLSGNYSDEIVPIIVEVEGEPVLASEKAKEMTAYKYMDTVDAERAEYKIENKQVSVKSEIKDKTGESSFNEGYTYSLLFNGFSMKAKRSDIEKIKQLDGVKNVYEDRINKIPEPIENEPKIEPMEDTAVPTADEYAKAPYEIVGDYDMHDMISQSGNGYRGQGMVIAVIDNDFDYGHDFLSGDIESPRITKEDIKNTEGLNAGKYISNDKLYRSEKVPFCFDYNTHSTDSYNKDGDHGTHVSGIAAGKNGKTPSGENFDGAAPEAQIIAMANHKLYNSGLIASIEDAVRLRADVITNSWGNDASIDDTFKGAVKRAVESGIMINFAAGNGYRFANNKENDTPADMPDYSSISSPGSYSETMAVASAENMYASVNNGFMLDTGDVSMLAMDLREDHPFNKTFADDYYEYVDCGLGYKNEFEGVEGKIAFIRRGTVTFKDKIHNAYNAGAVGIIMSNNADDLPFKISSEFYSDTDMPIATIGKAQGEMLAQRESKMIKAMGEHTDEVIKSDNMIMSGFSSWGCSSTLELKPDITAIGGRVYSSVHDGKYDEKNGTSMATPLYSGSMLLLKQYFKENYDKERFMSPEFLSALAMTSADIVYRDNGLPFSPRKQGAGILNLDNAINTPILLTGEDGKAKISLYDKVSDDFTIRFSAENFTDSDVTYNDVSMCLITDDYAEGDDGVNYVSDSQALDFTSDLPESITVKAHDKKSITVNVHIDDKEKIEEMKQVFTNGFFLEGYIRLNGEGQASIPYMGFYGNWCDQPLFDGTIYSGDSRRYNTYLSSKTNYDVITGEKAESEDGMYEVILGENRAANDEEAYPSEYYNAERFSGISPNGDGMADELTVNFEVLRNPKNLSLYIADAKGNEYIIDHWDRAASKYQNAAVPLDKDYLARLPEDDYKMILRASVDYKEAEDEEIGMRFYVDKTKPEISDAVISGTSLVLDISDNRNLMYVKITAKGTDGEDISFIKPTDGVSEDTVEFDISGVLMDTVNVEVGDYAMNITEAGFEEMIGEEEEGFLGDADMDGILTADDAAMVLKVAHDDEYMPPIAEYFNDFVYMLDIDKDSAVTEKDALIIFNKALDPEYKAEIKTLAIIKK